MVIVNVPTDFFDPSDSRVQPENVENNLELVRLRYFYEFETPFVIKCREEITIYNSSFIDPIVSIIYNLGAFRKNLHVYDFSGDSLEFHSEIEDYLDGASPSESYDIIIEFNNKSILPQAYGTIVLEYTIEVDDYTSKSGDYSLTFDLDFSPRTYIGIRSLSNKFAFTTTSLILASESVTFLPKDLWEENVSFVQTDQSVYFNCREFIDDCKFYFKFSHRLHPYQKTWFDLGVLIGLFAVFLITVLVVTGRGEINVIVPLVGLVNAYLLITKGWIFQNDMERVIKSSERQSMFDISYDLWYICLIVSLIIELAIAAVLNVYLTVNPNIVHFNATFEFLKFGITW